MFGESKKDGEAPEVSLPFAWIPYYTGGDASGIEDFTLLPTIAGDDWNHDPPGMICRNAPIAYDILSPLRGSIPNPEANALFALGAVHWMEPRSNEQGGTTINIELSTYRNQEILPGAFAASCHALVLSEKPSKEQPLTIEVECGEKESLFSKTLDEAEGWERSDTENQSICFEASFYWDQKHRRPAGASTLGW